MQKIGITGGIGSGKTTVCKVFELLGVPVYYSDLGAREVLTTDTAVKAAIADYFGNDFFLANGLVDRTKLAAAVFNNKEKLNYLNSIVHPSVARHFDAWVQQYINAPYVLREAAILFESGAHQTSDKIITVTAPLELKIERTMKRDNITKEQVLERINNQTSDEEKIKQSQFVIYNDEQQLLIPQVLKIHQQLMA